MLLALLTLAAVLHGPGEPTTDLPRSLTDLSHAPVAAPAPAPEAPAEPETPAAPHGALLLPGGGGVVTQRPGEGFSHGQLNAVDIAGGGALQAPMGGTVVALNNSIAGVRGGTSYGNYVKIRGDDGVVYLIGHLQGGGMPGLSVNGRVEAGQYLGQMGATGNATGIHVHVEVTNYGQGELNVIDWLARIGAYPAP